MTKSSKLPATMYILLSAVLLSTVACSAGNSASDEEVTSRPSAETDITSGEPSVGDRALKIGQARQGANVETTVVKVDDDFTEGAEQQSSILEEENGDRWFAVFVRYCVTKEDPSAEGASILPQNITVGTASGATYSTPSAYDNNFPSPRLPDTTLKSGCKEGWVNFALKEDVKIDRVFATDYLNSDEPFAEWRVS